MILCAPARAGPLAVPARAALAGERVEAARNALRECRICAHECGVNRFEGTSGRCHAGVQARIFSAQTEVSDEVELIPTFAIAFSGCDLRCDFCITGRQSWDARAGIPAVPARIAEAAVAALRRGARTVMVLGGEPTVHLPTALEIVSGLPDDATLIWKTNGHGTEVARELLDGLFDIWVVDYKFGNDLCAGRLAAVPDYLRVVRENLVWAATHTRLIVRHLLMPDHLDCCWVPVARWLARELPNVRVNLRAGFWPAWRARHHAELRRSVTDEEARRAWDIAEQCNLHLIP